MSRKNVDRRAHSAPDGETIGLIEKRLKKEWPGVDVQVLYLWESGKKLLYFSWTGKKHEHRNKPFPKTQSRIAIALMYGMLKERVVRRVGP